MCFLMGRSVYFFVPITSLRILLDIHYVSITLLRHLISA